MTEIIYNFAGKYAPNFSMKQETECFKLLKALRGLQPVNMDRAGLNQNELINLEDVTQYSRYFGPRVVRASLLVEVLWALKHDPKQTGMKGLTAALQVTDYTENPLLGMTPFQTPYCCDFNQRALFLCLWDEAGDPFNSLEFVEGDILLIANVSFSQVKVDTESSTHRIEGHIRGYLGNGQNIFPVTKIGEREKDFLIRRKTYLQSNMNKCLTRAPMKFSSRVYMGVPNITLGVRNGDNVLKIEDEMFYDAPRYFKNLAIKNEAGIESKRKMEDDEIKSEFSSSQEKKKIRIHPPPTISSLGKCSIFLSYFTNFHEPVKPARDGSYPDGIGSIYANGDSGKVNPRFLQKAFIVLGNIQRTEPPLSDAADWINYESDRPKFDFILVLEGQDSKVVNVRCEGAQAEYFLQLTAAR